MIGDLVIGCDVNMYAAGIFKNNSKLGNYVMIWYFEEPSRILTDDVGAMAGEQGVSAYHSPVQFQFI